MKDLWKNLLDLLKQQRKTFIRDANGKKIISDILLYRSLDKEILKIEYKISAENRKSLKIRGIILKKSKYPK